VARCRFPSSKVNNPPSFCFEASFPDLEQPENPGKNLPLTVAGQQWFFTIFPSVNNETDYKDQKQIYQTYDYYPKQ
jgi:hypothetical protein